MKLVAFLFALTCVALILIILVQKGKGGGLSSAFGGGMAGGVLGSKTGDFLTWVTISLVAVFLLLAVVMAKFYRPSIEDIARNNAQSGVVDSNTGTSEGGLSDTNALPVTSDANKG